MAIYIQYPYTETNGPFSIIILQEVFLSVLLEIWKTFVTKHIFYIDLNLCRDITINGITIPANSMIQPVMVEILKVWNYQYALWFYIQAIIA
jgi:hypothetical protein